MTYPLLFLLIALTTALALVIKQLQQQKNQYQIAQQKLRETELKNRKLEQQYSNLIVAHDESLGQFNELNEQIRSLSHQKNPAEIRLQELYKEKEKVRQEADDLYQNIEQSIEEKTKELEVKLGRLRDENTQLKFELRNKIIKPVKPELESGSTIALNITEKDLYRQEIKEKLLESLKESLRNIPENSRREHVISDIISNNSVHTQRDEFKSQIQNLFRSYTSMNPKIKSALETMGFEIVAQSNHYKIVFRDDPRYTFTFAKTPSDRRAGRNIARDICNKLL
ncbi:MAG: hypothetical protein ACFE0J_05110 [Elainellaceae cyanobacterium]